MAIGVMNVTTYGFTMVAARILGPDKYGAMAGLMATVLVIGVIQLGVQATAARRVAAEPEHLAQIERGVMWVTYRIALALGLALLVASPLLTVVLRLDGLLPAVLVAVAAVPLTITGGQSGVLQGERRWGELSWIYLSIGVGRLGLGAGLILWRPTEVMAMLGVTIGLILSAVLGWFLLRGTRDDGPVSDQHGARAILKESLHNGFALLAFFVLSNVDVIIARNLLQPHQAGLYAAGLILTKAVLFLPQFVVIVSFPSMSSGEGRRKALKVSVLGVAALGVLSTLAAAVLPSLALVFVGGGAFDGVKPYLWLFALVGTALAMLQLLLFSELARQGRRASWFIWSALVALVVLAPFLAHTLIHLVALVMAIDSILCATLFAMALRHHPAPADLEPTPV